nr:outer membrane protein [Candidatus Cloacimonadota bacterium]
MKKLFILVVALISLAGLFAQNVKLGYVNTDRILTDSNEAAEIARLFQLDRQNWTNQIRQLDSEIQQMERDFEIRKLSISEATKQDLQNQIDAKKQEAGRLLEEYFGENGRAEQRYRELISPLTQKIQEIITQIAEDENYTMIFDVSMGVVLYATASADITDQVLQELNKDTIAPTPTSPEGSFDKPEGGKEPIDNPFGEPFGEDLKNPEFKP